MTPANSGTSACYTVGGLTICLAEAPETIAFSMDKAFSLGRTVSSGSSMLMKAAIQMDDSYAAAMPDFVRQAYDRLPENENPVAFLGPGGEFCALVKNDGSSSYALFRPGSDEFHLLCQGRATIEAPLHFQSVLIPVIKHLLAQQGKLLVHAGSVATADGRGILFAGLSGSGKTTTSLALTRAGFRYISDDLVVLSFEDGRAQVEGIREHMNLTKRTIDFFPEFASVKSELKKTSYRGKAPVNPETLFGADRIASKAHIDAIMVIVIGKDGPQLVPVNPPAILNVILQNHTFETGMAIPRANMEILWNILGAVRTFRLLTGPDPSAMGDHVYHEFHGGASPSAPAPSMKRTRVGQSRPIDASTAAALLGSVLGHTLDKEGPACVLPEGDGATKLFRHHRLETHLARWSRDTGMALGDFDPERVLSNASALALKRATVTEKVHSSLADAGIDALLLRGPALAKRFYPDESLRTYRDIDLIIRKDLLLKAADVMLQLGFKADRGLDYWEGRGEWPFTDGETVVELHWEAYPEPFHGTAVPAVDDIWNNPDRVTIGTRDIGCLPTSHLLLSSFLHTAYEHQFDRFVRLVDIRQIMKQATGSVDWDWFMDAVRRTGTEAAIAKALECIDAVIPLTVPNRLRGLGARSLGKRLADLALPNDRIIAGPWSGLSLRRKILLRAIRPAR